MESNIYNYEAIRVTMKSPKRDILPNDVLIYKNGEKAVLYEQYFWAIMKFYDDNLNHVYNDDYTIIEVLRPHYERIYEKEYKKTK
ncbi:MAG: hypothetical protein IIV48_03205 [Clostridium sp.]|nr:hypothetical protein [Clostridium sp.]